MGIENLIENVDNQIIKIRTKSLDISFNELFDMYENSELKISPDYQRLFRWEEEKQSRFIESLILEMPVPPIFVIEVDDGVYELIDGLQRISSYLHFRGKRINENSEEFLMLQGCDIVPELNKLKFNDLPKALQIKIKRSFVRMEVIKKESETALKYHMFKRLNTGGELLTPQEIRNCTIRLLGSKGVDFLEKCSKDVNFKSVVDKIGVDGFFTKYDQELVLRFFAIKNDLQNYKYPVTEYFTNYLEKMTTEEGYFIFETEWSIFTKTFKFINDFLGADAFSSKTSNGNAKNDFVLYYFDAIAIGIANNIIAIEASPNQPIVANLIVELKFGEEIKAHKTGSINGVSGRTKLFSEEVQKILDAR